MRIGYALRLHDDPQERARSIIFPFKSGYSLSEALDIQRIELSEVHLLREAQAGNPVAMSDLLAPHLTRVWSICRGFFDDDSHAVQATVAFRDRLQSDIRQISIQEPFARQLFAGLFDHLVETLQPSERNGIEPLCPATGGRITQSMPNSKEIIDRVLRESPPYPRLIYLFSLVTGLLAAPLAEMIGIPEDQVRMSRTMLMVRIHEAMTQ